MKFLLPGLLFLSTAVSAQSRQNDSSFTWSGRIPAGRWIRVRNLSGDITVGASSGDRVEVTAVKRWRRGNPNDVRFEVKKCGSGKESVVVCAIWFENTTCDESHYETHSNRRSRREDTNTDLSVDFRVLVPKGVKVGVNTINGDVFVKDASAEIDAGSINGSVDVAADGNAPVNAETINGRVRARINRGDFNGSMNFSTINGSVTVDLPADLNADLDLSTVSGSINPDFEMTLSGRIDPRHLRAHVGKPGGPRIRLSTVNGSVTVHRRS